MMQVMGWCKFNDDAKNVRQVRIISFLITAEGVYIYTLCMFCFVFKMMI